MVIVLSNSEVLSLNSSVLTNLSTTDSFWPRFVGARFGILLGRIDNPEKKARAFMLMKVKNVLSKVSKKSQSRKFLFQTHLSTEGKKPG